MNWRNSITGARRPFAALLVLLLVLGAAFAAPVASVARPNGAGIVIRHGDGTIIYAYVEFDEASITSDELLLRSGLQVIVSVYSGLGTGVCTIDGEGCPSDNCYCKSYTSPAYFWHYYTQQNGAWREEIRGPSSRSVVDGDIDGWSWTADDSGLPAVSIDDIAQMNGIDRNAPDPTATPVPPTETPLPTVTPLPPTPSPTPPEATSTSTAPPATNTATATVTATATPTPASTSAAAQATPSPTPRATRTNKTTTPTQTASETPTPTKLPTLTPSPGTTTHAVAVSPDGTATPLQVATPPESSSTRTFMIFGSMAGIVVVVGGFVLLRKRGVV